MPPPRVQTASSAVPALWRFMLLNVEPVFAFGGVLMLLFAPTVYTSTMTRHTLTSIEPASDFIYTELVGGWLQFAFTEGIVLRLVDDVRAWKLLCIGMLLSDAAYVHSCAQAIGGWGVWFNVLGWTVDEWVVLLTTWPFVAMRLAIVSGVGLRAKVE